MSFISVLTPHQAEKQAKANYLESKATDADKVEPTVFGHYGIYELSVRAKYSEGGWEFSYMVCSESSVHRAGGFELIKDAIDEAIEVAEDKYQIFEEDEEN